jgi:hypothetical protein
MAPREFFDAALLERFRPELRYDRQYDYRTTAVETMIDNPGNLLRRFDGEVIARAGGAPALSLALLTGYPDGLEPRADDCVCQAPDSLGDARRMEREGRYSDRVYGRCVEDGGRTWLQYWFWLYGNPKNLFGFGKHEGDWEMIQVGLAADGSPEVLTYAQHNSGEAHRADEQAVEFVAAGTGRHPVVYVAPLSHASYFEAETHPYFVGIDHPFGDGPRARPPVHEFGEWKRFKGRWGNSERVIARKIGDGPPSPADQGSKWTQPARWHRSMKRRRLRVLLGRLVHAIGRWTYPPRPTITAHAHRQRVEVGYELAGHGLRTARHVYITVNDGEDVVASRAVRSPARTGSESLRVPAPGENLTVWASGFNRLRQRSDLVSTTPRM